MLACASCCNISFRSVQLVSLNITMEHTYSLTEVIENQAYINRMCGKSERHIVFRVNSNNYGAIMNFTKLSKIDTFILVHLPQIYLQCRQRPTLRSFFFLKEGLFQSGKSVLFKPTARSKE